MHVIVDSNMYRWYVNGHQIYFALKDLSIYVYTYVHYIFS